MKKAIVAVALAAGLLAPKPAASATIGQWWQALTPASKGGIVGAVVATPIVLWGINRANHSGQQPSQTAPLVRIQAANSTVDANLVVPTGDRLYRRVWVCDHVDGYGDCDQQHREFAPVAP